MYGIRSLPCSRSLQNSVTRRFQALNRNQDSKPRFDQIRLPAPVPIGPGHRTGAHGEPVFRNRVVPPKGDITSLDTANEIIGHFEVRVYVPR